MTLRNTLNTFESRVAWVAFLLVIAASNAVAESAACPLGTSGGDACHTSGCVSDHALLSAAPIVFGAAPQYTPPLPPKHLHLAARAPAPQSARSSLGSMTVLQVAPKTSPPA